MIRNDHRAAKADADAYALQVRETLQQLSDEALAFQSSIIVGGIDRTECDRELARRRADAYTLDTHRVEENQ